MKLKELIKGVKDIKIEGNPEVYIEGIAYDSREVKKGYLFVCIKGAKANGHDFIEEVIAKGAVAIVVEEDVDIDGITIIKVNKSREFLPIISSIYYNNPTESLKLIGVTGTNGKTSVTYIIKSILKAWGKTTGLIGTISIETGEQKIDSTKTTPESLDLQRILKDMVDDGNEYVVMEVSSHALDFNRVNSCAFHSGIFTNLSQDHLDLHKTMNNYKNAKEKLFYMTKKINIINIDDQVGQEIYDKLRKDGLEVLSYAVDKEADIRAKDLHITDQGALFTLVTPKFETKIRSSIPGKFSVYNCLAAAAFAYTEGLDKNTIYKGIEDVSCVPGRSELVGIEKPYSIIIDYSHTPDGLKNILKAIKLYAKASIITVFGCGGDRDKGKRPIMGQIAAKYSDYFIITSDNPRSEDPFLIIEEIERGIKGAGYNYICIESRKDAIRHAMKIAKENDIILLAGKGHETYQIRKDIILDFDERKVIKELLEEGI